MLKKMIMYVGSAEAGTFVCEMLEKSSMNVWLARGTGCLFAVVVALLLYRYWINAKVKESS